MPVRILHERVDGHCRGQVIDEGAFEGRDLPYLLEIGAVEPVRGGETPRVFPRLPLERRVAEALNELGNEIAATQKRHDELCRDVEGIREVAAAAKAEAGRLRDELDEMKALRATNEVPPNLVAEDASPPAAPEPPPEVTTPPAPPPAEHPAHRKRK